jgi:hypothetical protein
MKYIHNSLIFFPFRQALFFIFLLKKYASFATLHKCYFSSTKLHVSNIFIKAMKLAPIISDENQNGTFEVVFCNSQINANTPLFSFFFYFGKY